MRAGRRTMLLRAFCNVCLLLPFALAGCPSPRYHGAEDESLAFLALYVRGRSRLCGGDFELSYDGSDYRVVGGSLAVSIWELRACGERLVFPIRCDGGCWSYNWPTPRLMPAGNHQDVWIEWISTAIHAVPPCPGEDGHAFELKWIASSPNPAHFEIQRRCGTSRRVVVTCNDTKPLACAAHDMQ